MDLHRALGQMQQARARLIAGADALTGQTPLNWPRRPDLDRLGCHGHLIDPAAA
ncbi:hypothetical protein AB0368_38040 [Actinoplanes sp. NPDC051475]|uniref:hypothetical protein n=1 Tax=Actinoplanes sp. NPDC051475 TaxID=3157225 RepID=UPI00344EB8C1